MILDARTNTKIASCFDPLQKGQSPGNNVLQPIDKPKPTVEIYRWFLSWSCDNLCLVIPNNKTVEH